MVGALVGPIGGCGLGVGPVVGATVGVAICTLLLRKGDATKSLLQHAEVVHRTAVNKFHKAINNQRAKEASQEPVDSPIQFGIGFSEPDSSASESMQDSVLQQGIAVAPPTNSRSQTSEFAAPSKHPEGLPKQLLASRLDLEAFRQTDHDSLQVSPSTAVKRAECRAEVPAAALKHASAQHADSSALLKVPEHDTSNRIELQAARGRRTELQTGLKAVDVRAEQAEALEQQQQQNLAARLEHAEQLLKQLKGRADDEHAAQQSQLEGAEELSHARMQDAERTASTAAVRAQQAEAAVMHLRSQLKEVQQQLMSLSQEAEEATRNMAEAFRQLQYAE